MVSVQKQTIVEKMKNQVTFGHLLTIITGILIPFLVWMNNLEVKTQQIIHNKQEIEIVKAEVKEEREAREEIEKSILILNTQILNKLHDIELKLENKQNRK